jgi:hypothetical protein
VMCSSSKVSRPYGQPAGRPFIVIPRSVVAGSGEGDTSVSVAVGRGELEAYSRAVAFERITVIRTR